MCNVNIFLLCYENLKIWTGSIFYRIYRVSESSHSQRSVWYISSVIIFICSSCPRCLPTPYPTPTTFVRFFGLLFPLVFSLHFFFVKLHAHIQSNIYLKLMPEAFHYCARKNIYFCSASVVSLFLFSLGIFFFFSFTFCYFQCANVRHVALCWLFVSFGGQTVTISSPSLSSFISTFSFFFFYLLSMDSVKFFA